MSTYGTRDLLLSLRMDYASGVRSNTLDAEPTEPWARWDGWRVVRDQLALTMGYAAVRDQAPDPVDVALLRKVLARMRVIADQARRQAEAFAPVDAELFG